MVKRHLVVFSAFLLMTSASAASYLARELSISDALLGTPISCDVFKDAKSKAAFGAFMQTFEEKVIADYGGLVLGSGWYEKDSAFCFKSPQLTKLGQEQLINQLTTKGAWFHKGLSQKTAMGNSVALRTPSGTSLLVFTNNKGEVFIKDLNRKFLDILKRNKFDSDTYKNLLLALFPDGTISAMMGNEFTKLKGCYDVTLKDNIHLIVPKIPLKSCLFTSVNGELVIEATDLLGNSFKVIPQQSKVSYTTPLKSLKMAP